MRPGAQPPPPLELPVPLVAARTTAACTRSSPGRRPGLRGPLEHPLDLVVQTERDAHTTASSGLSISGIADVETTSPIDRACAIVFWSVRR